MARKFIYKRDAVKAVLRTMGIEFIKDTEDFDGTPGGIWLSADGGENSKFFDYYTTSRAYELGVRTTFSEQLQERGWYAEWYDPGTIMLWKI